MRVDVSPVRSACDWKCGFRSISLRHSALHSPPTQNRSARTTPPLMTFIQITLPSPLKLTQLERELLLSADDTAQVPFPEGNYSEVHMYLAALAQLAEKHHVCRCLRREYRAYYLTPSGKALKSQIMGSAITTKRNSVRPSLNETSRRRAILMLLPALLLLGSVPLQARLGETPGRVEARYGTPVKVENGICSRDFQCTYKCAGMTIVVHFLDEKSQYESFSNEDGIPLRAEEIQRLLEVNRRGGNWKVKEDTNSSKTWNLNSGDATAVYQHNGAPLLKIKTNWWDHYMANHPAESPNGAIERFKNF